MLLLSRSDIVAGFRVIIKTQRAFVNTFSEYLKNFLRMMFG